jgi:hypothetical protein
MNSRKRYIHFTTTRGAREVPTRLHLPGDKLFRRRTTQVHRAHCGAAIHQLISEVSGSIGALALPVGNQIRRIGGVIRLGFADKEGGINFAHRIGRSAAECRISSVEVTAAMLRRIAEVDPRLQPHTTV